MDPITIGPIALLFGAEVLCDTLTTTRIPASLVRDIVAIPESSNHLICTAVKIELVVGIAPIEWQTFVVPTAGRYPC